MPSGVSRGWLSIAAALLGLLVGAVGPSRAGEPVRLNAAYNAFVAANGSLWVAKEAGLFEKHGLALQLLLIESGTTAVQALLAGEVPLVHMASAAAIQSRVAGSDLLLISGVENLLPYSLIAQKAITRPEQLRGKRLAISRFGSASDFAARLILERLGLQPERDVAILQVGGTSTRFAAVQRGTVESTVITLEFGHLARKLGFSVLAEALRLQIEFIQNGLVTTPGFLQRQPEAARRFLRGYVEGIQPRGLHPGAGQVPPDPGRRDPPGDVRLFRPDLPAGPLPARQGRADGPRPAG
ncbi:MAG: ABC transporter substrate-binding protein [Deltaproteobacteria bacterium]|nr:ABC transporter substrate-binding protein [Deltaproteobacteria bacterium]